MKKLLVDVEYIIIGVAILTLAAMADVYDYIKKGKK